MLAIMVAVGVCDKVSVFGFGKAADAKHHYHSNQKTELDLHDYEAEYNFYRDLVERPQIITAEGINWYHWIELLKPVVILLNEIMDHDMFCKRKGQSL